MAYHSGMRGGRREDSTRIVRVTMQVDFIGASRNAEPEVFSKAVDQVLHRLPGGPIWASVDWWELRVEVADPGDTDDPEWEVVR